MALPGLLRIIRVLAPKLWVAPKPPGSMPGLRYSRRRRRSTEAGEQAEHQRTLLVEYFWSDRILSLFHF